LDFVNTFEDRFGEHPQDFFAGYPDLVHWSYAVELFTKHEATQRLASSASWPTQANRMFEQALPLRETIYRIFSAIARTTLPLRADLDALKEVYTQTMTHARLIPTDEGFIWNWIEQEREEALDFPLWSVIYSAVELLTSSEVRRVKQCPEADCGWLFLDTSKNGSRVWCSMESCGSRAKMRRQRALKRSAASSKQEIDPGGNL
jgi:predicted RNA-binding Zn ribbon-like protein